MKFRDYIEQNIAWRRRMQIPQQPANNPAPQLPGHHMQNPITQAWTFIQDEINKEYGAKEIGPNRIDQDLEKIFSGLSFKEKNGIFIKGVANTDQLDQQYINVVYSEAVKRKYQEMRDQINKLRRKNPSQESSEYQQLIKLRYIFDTLDWEHWRIASSASARSNGQFSVMVPYKTTSQKT